jgi:hypothetical protein
VLLGIGDHRVRDVLLLGAVEQLQSAALTASSKEALPCPMIIVART